MRLEPDEPGEVVFFCEAGEDFCFVLADADGEVAGHTKVEHPRLAGYEVDAAGTVHWRDCDIGRG